MSRAAYWAARQAPPRPLDKLVLIAFADHADKMTTECFPSVAALCEWTGCDRKTVMKSVASLEAAGLLIDTGRRCGRTRQIKVYRLPIETVPETASLSERVPETGPLNSTVFPTKESQKRDTEPPKEPISQKTSSSSRKRAHAKADIPADFAPIMTGKTAAVVAGWPPGRLEAEIEAMADWHAKEGKLSADWQASWRTWVRNSTRWETSNEQSRQAGRSAPNRGSARDAIVTAFDRVDFG